MRTLICAALAMLAPLSLAQAQATKPHGDIMATPDWSASWITHPNAAPQDAGVYHFRKTLDLAEVPKRFSVRVSADNRYRLFVNGVSVATGPARSDPMHWRYETIDLAPHLKPGSNTITATVWNWGENRPVAQMSLQTGFLMQGDGEASGLVDTGDSWRVLRNRAFEFTAVDGDKVGGYYVAAPGEVIDARTFPWGWQDDDSNALAWQPARIVPPGKAGARGSDIYGVGQHWQLVPSPLPQMEEQAVRFAEIERSSGLNPSSAFLNAAGDLDIPANTTVSILLDQGELTSAYPVLLASGGAGASMQLTYAEALVDADGNKGNRNETAGKVIRGLTDRILFDGGTRRRFQTLWWRTWRYVQLDIKTNDEQLELHDMHGIFTAYPFRQNAAFSSDQDWIAPVWDINWRILRLSAFDTFMDTPYYEQLQYVGDTRVQSLISLYNSGDDRLMRNAIQLYDWSRIPEGITASRYPSADPQYIPPFSLWWIAMVHDYWMHRDDPQFVRQFLPGIRGVIGWYERHTDETGMLGPMPWWSFLDWNPEFTVGRAPGSTDGNSTALTLQFAYALQRAAELEERFGQPAQAQDYRTLAGNLNAAARKHAWDSERGLFADTPERASYSQHSNALAVLSGAVEPGDQHALMKRVLDEEDLLQATYYFRFYVDEAMHQAGLADRYLERLEPWRDMIRLGLTTTPEEPDPTRSDSHAWSAHPNYHLLATALGVRPMAEGFGKIEIAPSFGPMQRLGGTIPHPAGKIEVSLQKLGNKDVGGTVTLPPGTSGLFRWQKREIALKAGTQQIDLAGK